MSGKRKSKNNNYRQVNSEIVCSSCKDPIKKGDQYWVKKTKKGKVVNICDNCAYAQTARAVQKHNQKYGNLVLYSID